MWNRREVKEKGKASFKRNYWTCVLVGFIYLVLFASSGYSGSSNSDEIKTKLADQSQDPQFVTILLIILAAVGVALALYAVIRIFAFNPLEVGCRRFFVQNLDENATVNEIGYSFKNNYMNAVVGIFLRDLLVLVGFILFIFPGIYLAYTYRLVPYILAEDPEIKGTDALKKSKEMMNGHKWAAFVYDLSFIPWILLGIITCGIVSVFYVSPYKFNADAALYEAIKG